MWAPYASLLFYQDAEGSAAGCITWKLFVIAQFRGKQKANTIAAADV
jgi:hypothetical protein